MMLCCFDRCCVNIFLEWCDAKALCSINETLILNAVADIDLNDTLYHFRHLACRKRGSYDFAYGRTVTLCTTYGYLIKLAAVFVHAKYANIAYMVMAASIDATRHIQFKITNVM